MNRWLHSLFGLSFAGLVALLALHGPALLATLQAAWTLGLAVSAEAPAGLRAFTLALALAVAIQPWLRGALPPLACPVTREFVIESVALVTGFGVTWLQCRSGSGALLGLLAGLCAPLVQKGLVAAWRVGERVATGARPRRSQ